MDNPETQATFDKRHKTNRNKKSTTQKAKKISNTDPTENHGAGLVAGKW